MIFFAYEAPAGVPSRRRYVVFRLRFPLVRVNFVAMNSLFHTV